MDSRKRVAIFAALAVLATAALATMAAPAGAAPKTGRLVAFRSCPDLLNYAKAHATPYVNAYGFGRSVGVPIGVGAKGAMPGVAASSAAAAADSTPQQGVDYSGTNVQETGVDEPDLVKTNGNTLFTVAGNQLDAVDVTGNNPKLLDTLTLDNSSWSNQLLLYGTHLLVLSRGGYWIEPLPAMPARMIAPYASSSTLTEIDVSNPSALRVEKTLTLDGAYVDARQIGSTVRIVTSSPVPIALPFVTPTTTMTADAAKAQNAAVVAHSRVSS